MRRQGLPHLLGRGNQGAPGPTRYPDAFARYNTVHAHPSARTLARLGAARLAAGDGQDPALVELAYLRPPDAEANWATRHS